MKADGQHQRYHICVFYGEFLQLFITPLLCRNHLTCLQGLEACTALRYLDVSRNQLTSLAGLHQCKLLQSLDAGHNALPAMPPQQHLPCALLTSLQLNNNRITAIDALPFVPMLQHLDLQVSNFFNLVSALDV